MSDSETRHSYRRDEPRFHNAPQNQDADAASRNAHFEVKREIELDPSEVTETLKTCGENKNLELLGEVYHLGQGGSMTMSNSSISILKEIKSPMGNTLLHIAAWYGNNEVVDLVAEQAPDLLFMYNSNKDTALHVASRAGRLSTVERLLAAYTNIQKRDIAEAWITYFGLQNLITPENYDAKENMHGLILLVKKKNGEGNMMLHEAMMNGRSMGAKILQVLETYNTEDYQGESLSKSCYASALNITNNAKQSVLYLAVENGDKEAVKLILEKSSENENVRLKGLSPLEAAIRKRDQDMLSIILDKKPDWIHLPDRHGRLPLHYAASRGYHEGVICLLEKCKCCSMQNDNNGYFPLHLASQGGHVEVVKELVGCCLDPTEILDKYGRNILHIAAKSGKHEVLRYILQNHELEKLINQKDNDGNTPLHLATNSCRPKTVLYLTWDNKVDLGVVNQNKETAFDILNAIYQPENPSLGQLLTWTALKSAGVKPSSGKVSSDSQPNETILKMGRSDFEPNALFLKVLSISNKDSVSNTERYKDKVDTLLLVSTLIITASVAACLSVPGEAEGAAHNLHKAMFHLFIFCITISLFSSISATIILFWTRLGVIQLLAYALKIVMPLLGVALISLSLAFMAGVYTVISKLSLLATMFLIITVILVLLVSFLYILLFLPSSSTIKPLRYISYYPFIFLASLAEP